MSDGLIGRVRCTRYGSEFVYELSAGGWRVTVDGRESPGLARSQAELARELYRGPQDGWPGVKALVELADRTGGTLEDFAPPEPNPDVVY